MTAGATWGSLPTDVIWAGSMTTGAIPAEITGTATTRGTMTTGDTTGTTTTGTIDTTTDPTTPTRTGLITVTADPTTTIILTGFPISTVLPITMAMDSHITATVPAIHGHVTVCFPFCRSSRGFRSISVSEAFRPHG